MTRRKAGKTRTVLILGAVLAAMLVLVAEAPPLYRLLCGATGLNGTVQRVATDTATAADKVMTVRFNTDTEPNLPWHFRPMQDAVQVKLGVQTLVYFEAENLSDQPIVGHATYNVTPLLAGKYFDKIQCFCFTEERLGAHQRVDMPVLFYVDPKIAKDPTAGSYTTITLSYTFFRSKDPDGALDLARFGAKPGGTAAPNADHGARLFEARCTACHAIEGDGIGPHLGGVYGRKAGSVAGYTYSDALEHSGIVWTKAALDQWLAGPTRFVPGARMPVDVPDPGSRADIIAYLAKAPH
jgi:cytochrome c oxidase assembly protein subunit 11